MSNTNLANALREIGRQNPHISAAMDQTADAIDRLEAENAELVEALRELRAVVLGECPSLLNEDSGDNGTGFRIDAVLAKHKDSK